MTSPPEGAPPQAVWRTYVWVEDADETAAKVRAAGGTVLTDPMDVGDSGRMAVLADPEGAAFIAWQAGAHRGAAVVNEHASLNFNNLNVRDIEGAKAFYGAVFGWDAIEVGYGHAWALPAYGDFLFAVTRSYGLAAHYVEEVQRERPMRTIDPTVAHYDGPTAD